MPFIVTEPQRIEGTELGFAVYPYHFNFQDFLEKDRKFNNKLLIFKMKHSPFAEVESVLFESRYSDQVESKYYVNDVLKEFIKTHQQYIIDREKLERFFDKNIYNRKHIGPSL